MIILLILAIFSISLQADQNLENKLEKTYRNLLQSIEKKDIEAILKYVHKGGVHEADSAYSKEKLRKFLQNPDDSFAKRFFELFGDFAKNICKESGRFPISPYAFKKYYGEKYTVSISRYKESNFYQISSLGSKEGPISGCQFIVFSVSFKYESDGEFYLTGVFGP